MASWQMSAVSTFIRFAYKRHFATVRAGRSTLARAKGSSAPPRAVTKRYDVHHRLVRGFDVYVVRSAAAPPSRDAVIYLHGGAYTSEIVKQHWALIAYIARRSRLDVHVPIYGLAPRHHALEARDLVTTTIAGLTPDYRACYLLGDSAGGGLALLAAQAVAGRPGTPVAGLTAIAPWLDLSLSNPAIDDIEPGDPWLTRAGLRTIAEVWADGLPLTDARISPLYGDLAALPPLQVLVGTRDIAVADCRTLRDRLPAGVPLTYHEEIGAIHAYPLLPVPEAQVARRAIVDQIHATLGGTGT